jgi:hypothetical protein
LNEEHVLEKGKSFKKKWGGTMKPNTKIDFNEDHNKDLEENKEE